jgi:hypothetical protein
MKLSKNYKILFLAILLSGLQERCLVLAGTAGYNQALHR